MKKIFADAEEKFVKNVILFGHTDKYLYEDEEHTQKIDAETAMNVCQKGAIIHYGGAYHFPVFFKEDSGHVEVTIATAISASASNAVVLYSEEYTED